jgi:hypothetical protein
LDDDHPEQQLELEPESIVAELEADSILVVELELEHFLVPSVSVGTGCICIGEVFLF